MNQEGRSKEVYYYKNEERKEVIMEKLREQGFRVTNQRKILLDVILDQNCASCKEIFYEARSVDSTIGISTVYRMINVLEEIGVFSKKNIYKISCSRECDKENICQIEFEDNTFYELSENMWYGVITEGLKACGLSMEKEIINIKYLLA